MNSSRGSMEFAVGDATRPAGTGPRVIVHVCNDLGAWGRGFVVALSRRWPEPQQAYLAARVNDHAVPLRLGQVQIVEVEPSLWVANMVAQRGLRSRANPVPLRYGALELCLRTVADFAVERGASVHMPRIGCGLAGGRWSLVEDCVRTALCEQGLQVVVYDLGTSASGSTW